MEGNIYFKNCRNNQCHLLNIYSYPMVFPLVRYSSNSKDNIRVHATSSVRCLQYIDHVCTLNASEVFRNEILPAWLKSLNVEVILISGFMNSEIRITSNNFCRNHKFRNKAHFIIKVFLPGWQATRIHFEKPLVRGSFAEVGFVLHIDYFSPLKTMESCGSLNVANL